jgi:ABC-type transport system involved in multi-copper enzyme maturation permease subunit
LVKSDSGRFSGRSRHYELIHHLTGALSLHGAHNSSEIFEKMRNPFHTPFVAVFQNEVLLNSRRVAPYALTILFAANAAFWWSLPAVQFGWATNSDFYIARNLLTFSFLLGLPIITAVIMGDPVIRDFRDGVDPLIFSKPVSRAQYLLGKFFGNFFVLVCCQAVFPVTQLVLQAFPTSHMIVLPIRVFPYFKHFFFFLVITHLTPLVISAVLYQVPTWYLPPRISPGGRIL